MVAPISDPIADVHAAVEGLLKPFFAPKWRIEMVPSPMTISEFTTLMGQTPWIGIGWSEFTPDTGNGRSLKGTHKLRLTLAVKNSDRPARFLGDRHGPGLYASIVTAACALHGRTLDTIGSIAVTKAGQSFADGYGDKGAAIGIVEISIGSTILAAPFDTLANAPAFAALVSEFELPDGSTVTDTIDMTGDPA